MDEIEGIARCMALYARSPEVQLVQTGFRKRIVDAWGIRPGARILEIGCGQGDLTAVLAHAVGPAGHVTACDLAAPDYGAPVSIGASAEHLKRSPLGPRIAFKLRHDILDPAKAFPDGSFDYVVLAHCSWYFDSTESLARSLSRVRSWARYLCLSEWDLFPKEVDQLAHALSVVIQGQVEAFREASPSNIRTPFTKERLEALLGTAGWKKLEAATIDSSSLQDARWEIDECVRASAKNALETGLPKRFADIIKAEVELLGLVADTYGRKSLCSFTILAERSDNHD